MCWYLHKAVTTFIQGRSLLSTGYVTRLRALASRDLSSDFHLHIGDLDMIEFRKTQPSDLSWRHLSTTRAIKVVRPTCRNTTIAATNTLHTLEKEKNRLPIHRFTGGGMDGVITLLCSGYVTRL
ncbi:hypothetical protein TNCV_1548681 [Trichonephila clavipes]|nr:hypothetical protein TNCV_1548681 [Trichonephila clavipes]